MLSEWRQSGQSGCRIRNGPAAQKVERLVGLGSKQGGGGAAGHESSGTDRKRVYEHVRMEREVSGAGWQSRVLHLALDRLAAAGLYRIARRLRQSPHRL